MDNENFYMLAKTMFGLEQVLAKELEHLGAQNIKILNRAVSFKGDKGFLYKANLNLRTALRILKPVATFSAKNKDELYKNACKINWPTYFNVRNTFATYATTNSEHFKHSKYASLVLKDAIADTFRKQINKRPYVDTKNPEIVIDLHIQKNTCTVSLDSSGKSLHKRGYKSETVIAPINEVLAAGLILLSDWNQVSNFHDPMCGSGTILIEAALIGYNIPVNIFRKDFSFQYWKDFDSILWGKIKKISLNKKRLFKGNITGGDNFQKAVRISRKNIENIKLYDIIKIKNQDFFDSKVYPNTLVIFNPPYGKRNTLGVTKFYKKISDTLKNNYQECEVWIISSDIENMKMIGLKPTKKIKLQNGKIDCSFRKFEIYEGSKKSKSIT